LLNVAKGGKRPQNTEIIFVGLIDEENAQTGSRTLTKKRLKVDLGIVGEPTELELITAHKGDLWLKLITRGTAAHGARPELGVNAVHKMAHVVEILETDYARSLTKKRHPILGCGTVNVGMIRGGTQPNIVPDHCEIQVDRRTIPGETDEKVQQDLLKFVRAFGVAAELVNSKSPCYALETDPNLPLVRDFMSLLGQKKPLGVDFFCDASILAHGGIPCVVFGPGNIAQAHTQDEWIELESLKTGTRMLQQFLERQP
jgi:acetylornithine deacetylase/succinyl-diaminopimelate desuccinylase-like protein